MGKKDHPAFQGRPDQAVPYCLPHILPSVFDDRVYFLHQVLGGEHIVEKYSSKAEAEAALAVLNGRMGKR